MGVFVQSITLREAIGDDAMFPERLRQLLCQVIETFEVDELERMLSKHETDRANLDGQIEANLRQLEPSLLIEANCRISGQTKFDNDLVIESDEALVCLEIEKGNTSRFEFDILKMQAFASCRGHPVISKPLFGAFIVPADNTVVRHISGRPGESSFRYLVRLCKLVSHIQPLHLEDILIVGYAVNAPIESKRRKTPAKAAIGRKRGRQSERVLSVEKGLLAKEAISNGLRGYPTDLVFYLRSQLAKNCPQLREKLNLNSRYLGYGLAGGSDALYVYVRRRRLEVHIGLPVDLAKELRRSGFEVHPRNNYQARKGWLTGLLVPHDTDKPELIVGLALTALQGDEAGHGTR